MLSINNQIVRETRAIDPGSQHPIVLKLDPPGFQIGLRLKHKKETKYIDILDLFNLAFQSKLNNEEGQVKPPPIKTVGDHVIDLLMNHGRIHFSQIRKLLREEKELSLSKAQLGPVLTALSRSNQITAERHGWYK